jgi:hypothetical protein
MELKLDNISMTLDDNLDYPEVLYNFLKLLNAKYGPITVREIIKSIDESFGTSVLMDAYAEGFEDCEEQENDN